MTGYAAVIRLDDAPVDETELRAMLPSLRARGPHGDLVMVSRHVGLTAAVLDVGDRRLLPAFVARGNLLVAGQLRLDGRDALVEQLQAAVHDGSVNASDLALLALAWNAWGADAAVRVLGDFSVVVHDSATRTTTLVRDIYGVRPLYYHAAPHRLVVSNALDAVRSLPGVAGDLDEDALTDFLAAGFIEDAEATPYREIRCVPPAHMLSVHRDGRRVLRRYWELPSLSVDRTRSEQDVIAIFRNLLTASVRDRVRSVRATVFMSGGLDSTTLAAIAAGVTATPASLVARTTHVPAFVRSDEVVMAQSVAAAIGCTHVLSDSSADSFSTGDDDGRALTPEPVDDPGLAGLHQELLHASRHSPVILWGEGADALLMPPDLVDQLRAAPMGRVLADIAAFVWRFRRRPNLALRALAGRAFGRGRALAHESPTPDWIRADLRTRRQERLNRRPLAAKSGRAEAMRALEQWHWRPMFELLDADTHALPIDVRFPYLDRRVIEFCLGVPPIPWTQRKHLLRETARDLLPEDVRLAPKRGMVGLYEARLQQWWSRSPSPFVPSRDLASLVDVAALPRVAPGSPPREMAMHLRLRQLDQWLRTREGTQPG